MLDVSKVIQVVLTGFSRETELRGG